MKSENIEVLIDLGSDEESLPKSKLMKIKNDQEIKLEFDYPVNDQELIKRIILDLENSGFFTLAQIRIEKIGKPDNKKAKIY